METKAHAKQREKHHQTLGGVTHGVHHGVAHGQHTVMHSRNVHNNGRVKPDPHKGGAHGWVYTTKKGDTLASLQQRAWGAGGNKRGVNITAYANNFKLLKSQGQGYKGSKNNPSQSIAYYNKGLRPGTRIIL